MAKRTGLGRGISALIPSGDDPKQNRPVDVFFPDGPAGVVENQDKNTDSHNLLSVPGAVLAYLNPKDIVPNAQQPRINFDETDLKELELSIGQVGVLQPIVVRPHATQSGRYELIMGERRLRASLRLGLDQIPAVVKNTADEDMLRDALLENLHRAELNPLEEASAYQQLLNDFGITQEKLAQKIGRSRPQISNTIRLLKLPEKVQLSVASGVLSAGHARAILSLVSEDAMTELSQKIIREDLSVRAAEAVVSGTVKRHTPRKTQAGKITEHLNELAEQLGDRLDTRVHISLLSKKGHIKIDFSTIADLNRILTGLGSEPFSP